MNSLPQSSNFLETKDQIKKKVKNILQQNGVKKANFFGSIARGDFEESSDIDILIEFEGKKSLVDLIRLKNQLEDELLRKVDINTFNAINPLIKPYIQKDMEKIF